MRWSMREKERWDDAMSMYIKKGPRYTEIRL